MNQEELLVAYAKPIPEIALADFRSSRLFIDALFLYFSLLCISAPPWVTISKILSSSQHILRKGIESKLV